MPVSGMLALLLAIPAQTSSGGQAIVEGAGARIEQCRKGDVTLRIVDGSGKPMRGAKVEIVQTAHAFLFGCNLFCWKQPGHPDLEAAYRRRFAALFNYATLAFYWPTYEPRQGQPRHAEAEEVARWCRASGIAVKGHPLMWNFFEPGWLPADPDQIRRLQMDRATDCVRRFAGLIDRWDVVNEIANYDRAETLKQAPRLSAAWQKIGQMEMSRQCFVAVREAAPKAMLLVNDYELGPKYQKVVEGLRTPDGRPLYDAIGIQSHQHGGAWSARSTWDVCERYAKYGVPLHFTETTLLSGEQTWDEVRGRKWSSTPDGEKRQARDVVQFYTLLFSHPAVEAITWWDLSDRHAWKQAPAGLLREDMSAKPAYDELVKLIKDAWTTRLTLQASDDGLVTFRGFHGTYQITASLADRKATKDNFTLERNQPNRWTVELR